MRSGFSQKEAREAQEEEEEEEEEVQVCIHVSLKPLYYCHLLLPSSTVFNLQMRR
jgi:hypothetical protein